MWYRFWTAQARYAEVRERIYRKVLREAEAAGRLPAPARITDLDRHALAAYRAQWVGHEHPTDVPVWDWEALARPVQRRPTGLRLAIWSGDPELSPHFRRG
jgi:hypothetical protein